ncbi:MAG: O-antigen ligase family protein [Phycisphaeraceae bacterium]|nr:O-antigen ligase family protein [Phycisphaeraceae bacterium]
MLSLSILMATFAAFVVLCVKPKWGSYIVWFVLFTYPHNWWFQRQWIPLNIGVDDLFCILLFLIVVLRRNLFGGVAVRWGYAFWVLSGFLWVASIAIISGSLDAPAFERVLYYKDVMKLFVYWGLFYAILHCIDDVQDVRRQFTWFALASVVGGGIVILHGLFPGRMSAWSNPLLLDIEGVTGRASGAFLNPNNAACIMACSLAMIVTAIRLQRSFVSKLCIYGLCGILLVALLVTRSRSGLLAMAGTFCLMAVVGQNKRVAWMILLGGILLGTFFVGIRQAVQERVATVYSSSSGTWGGNVTGRVDMWISYVQTATPQNYLLGQGHRAGIARNSSETHSAYVSLLTVYGLGGLAWAVFSVGTFFRKAFEREPYEDPLIMIVRCGCVWALVAWGIYAMSADAISSQYPRYLLFYMVVLLDRASAISCQVSQEVLWEDEYLDAMESFEEACEPFETSQPECTSL